MTRRIAIIGPESTGKSTLTRQLADCYGVPWVPEYARGYLAGLARPYQEPDLLSIARGQLEEEDRQALAAREILFCDTDLYVIKVWSEHSYGRCDPWILRQIASRKYDLYLLTYIDLPWTEDPQREHPEPRMREYFYRQYLDIVLHAGTPWALVRGAGETRLRSALEAVAACPGLAPSAGRRGVGGDAGS
jgi:NadR type nicotinamide-nucleotide adenylyltransferase